MADVSDRPDRDGVRREQAEHLADRAAQARRAGSPADAEGKEDEALRTDPEGLANELAASDAAAPETTPDARDGDTSDEAVHAITGTVRPGSDAPSRAGISGSGSGADNM